MNPARLRATYGKEKEMTDSLIGIWIMAGAAVIYGLVVGFYSYKFREFREGLALGNPGGTTGLNYIMLCGLLFLVGELTFFPLAIQMTRNYPLPLFLFAAFYIVGTAFVGAIVVIMTMFVTRLSLEVLMFAADRFLSIRPHQY